MIFHISYLTFISCILLKVLRITGGAGAGTRKKITKTKNTSMLFVDDDADDDEYSARPVSDFTAHDIGLVARCMSITKIDMMAWLKTKSLCELMQLIDINEKAPSDMNYSQKMIAYTEVIDELKLLKVLNSKQMWFKLYWTVI